MERHNKYVLQTHPHIIQTILKNRAQSKMIKENSKLSIECHIITIRQNDSQIFKLGAFRYVSSHLFQV